MFREREQPHKVDLWMQLDAVCAECGNGLTDNKYIGYNGSRKHTVWTDSAGKWWHLECYNDTDKK